MFDRRQSLTLFWLCVYAAVALECIDSDSDLETCSDHEQCCGGCCFFGECYDTYRSCLSPFDVCHEHYCRGDENCVAYMPPQCPGCSPIPLCIVTND